VNPGGTGPDPATGAAWGDGPLVTDDTVVFRLTTGADVTGVRLKQELVRPRNGPAFDGEPGADSTAWELRFPRLDVDRMEYQFVLDGPGGETYVTDPGNPATAPGAFGTKSVVEFPGYRPPGWLDGPAAPPGRLTRTVIASAGLGADMTVWLWSPPGFAARRPLPLLVAHDGPDYARYAALPELLGRMIAGGRLPPVRAALLAPVDRGEHYAASPLYTAALTKEILPALDRLAPSLPGTRVGLGASLGALAMLHASRSDGSPFGALLLQSGSFFTHGTDAQEAGFERFDRVATFVEALAGARSPERPVPVVMTCGIVEENLANNQSLATVLARQGHAVALHTVRDAHNWVAWRDALDPHLIGLLTAVAA
jgi:enterochelin esterase family protein